MAIAVRLGLQLVIVEAAEAGMDGGTIARGTAG